MASKIPLKLVDDGTGGGSLAEFAATDTIPLANLPSAAGLGAEPAITAGTGAQFWRGDKTWTDFATTVRASVLAGLSVATATAVVAADTVLVAAGKFQAQINSLELDKLEATANAVSASKLVTARTINGVAFDGTANITLTDDTKEPDISVGTTAQFWRGDKTWTDFATTVRASTLTGLSVATATAVVAADTVLVAAGKFQAQINSLELDKLEATANAVSASKLVTARTINGVAFDGTANITVADGTKEPAVTPAASSTYWNGLKAFVDFATTLRAAVLTGLTTATNSAALATDSLLVAIGKLQAQVTARLALAGGKMTGALNEATIVTLASAATVNIGAAAANTVNITGTTAITAFDNVASGASCRVIFAAALTLTHNATTLSLPGLASIVTAPGDIAEFFSLGAGNWDCATYTRADGQPVGVVSLLKGGTGATTQAGARTALGLVPTATNVDTTPGRLLKVADFGLGASTDLIPTIANLDTTVTVGFYKFNAGATGSPEAGSGGSLIVHSLGSNYIQQIVMTVPATTTNPVMKYRHSDGNGTHGPWVNMIHSANMVGSLANGAVMEYGNNAAGYYWKFANGLLICKGAFLGYAAGVSTFSFPVAFADIPAVHCNILPSTGYDADWTTWAQNGSSINFHSPNARANNSVFWGAQGRWF